MIARLVVLAALLGGLWTWERALSGEAASDRTARTRQIGRILSAEDLADLDVAAVRLDFGDGRRATYARMAGLWRCIEASNAPADVEALDSLINMVVGAEGRVQSDDTSRAADYGIGTAETIRFSICGRGVLSSPDGDVQWTLDLGRSMPGGDGCFVRPRSSSAIWAIDRDPRAVIEGASLPNLPPLLDPALLTRAWLAGAGGFARIFVDRADGSAYELSARPRDISPELMQQGEPPYEWVIDAEGDALVPPQERAMAYAYFLQTVGYRAILDPRRAQDLGLAGPHDQLTLFPTRTDEVQPLVLQILPVVEGAGAPVVNRFVEMLYEVEPDLSALLTPSRDLLLGGADNPWDAYLQRRHEGR